MASLESVNTARSLATPVPQVITAVNTGPWMVVQYVPSLGTGATAATMAIAAGSDTITFTVGATTPAGADVIGNTSGEILTTADATSLMGEVVDKINAAQAWRAYLVGALRADDAGTLQTLSSATAMGANGITCYGDTSASKEISLAISGEKFVNNGKGGHVKDWDSQCENSMLYGNFLATSASLHVLRYYTGKQGSTEVQVGSDVPLTSATAKEQGENSLAEAYVQATRGQRLVIRVIGVSNTAPSVPTIQVVGKTAVLDGSRIVTEDNY